MDIYTNLVDNRLIIHLSGEIDHHVVGHIKDKIDKAYTTTPARDMVFDFSQISFMDSSGIGLIMGRYKHLPPGGRLSLVGVSDHIRRVFDLSGLGKFVNIEPSIEAVIGGSYVR